MNNSLQNKNSAMLLCIAHASLLHNNMRSYVNCNFKQMCELRYGNVIKVNKKIKRESGKNWRWKEALGFNNKTRVERCPLHRLFPLEGCRNIPLRANKTDNCRLSRVHICNGETKLDNEEADFVFFVIFVHLH